MKIIANDIRVGNVLEHNKRLLLVTKIAKTQPGKGGAYVQAEMKDIREGNKFNERFRSSETVERARLEEQDFQYLYPEGEQLVLMDLRSYEQHNVNRDLAGDAAAFLTEGMQVTCTVYDDGIIAVSLPEDVEVEIEEAEPVVKGQTASSSYKPAIVAGGVKVMVPQFIGAGDKIIVKSADGSYVRRAEG